jgi:hypothetical protein
MPITVRASPVVCNNYLPRRRSCCDAGRVTTSRRRKCAFLAAPAPPVHCTSVGERSSNSNTGTANNIAAGAMHCVLGPLWQHMGQRKHSQGPIASEHAMMGLPLFKSHCHGHLHAHHLWHAHDHSLLKQILNMQLRPRSPMSRPCRLNVSMHLYHDDGMVLA